MNSTDSRPLGVRSVLARSAHFKVWVNVAFVLATVASAARYVGGHGFEGRAPLVLGGAAVLIVSYGAGPLRRTRDLATGVPVHVIPDDAELTTQQAADLLGLSRTYVVRLIDQGSLPAHEELGLSY